MERRSLAALREAAAIANPDASLLAELLTDPRKGAQTIYRSLVRRQEADRARTARSEFMLQFERAAKAQGFQVIAGVDEAGRGPLAGPIVAAAVILSEPLIGIDDSKRLTWEQRELFYNVLTNGPHHIGTAIISPADIDRFGIQQANYQAMAEAIAVLSPPPDYLLIDGFRIPGLRPPQERLIKGDRRSQSIAAASVIAKVTRDRLMDGYDIDYPVYGFGSHKGYGTEAHLAAIAKHGPCPIHRMSFAPLSRLPETGDLF